MNGLLIKKPVVLTKASSGKSVYYKSVNEEMKEIKKCVDNNKVELKEQLRIQEDRSRRNNVRFDGIPETENETWEETETKLRKFLYDELGITEELYIEQHEIKVARRLQMI